VNLHYSQFLGQVITIQRPLIGTQFQRPVPLFSQDQTAVDVALVQPITPLLKVYQAVKIARADEQIAKAKAAAPGSANDASVEEAYYKLLIAQRRLTYAELNLRSPEHRPPASASSIVSVHETTADSNPVEPLEAERAVVTSATEVRELAASLDRLMGWPEDTRLELAPPEPLSENLSLEEIADKTGVTSSPAVVEAEQNVVKARAAYMLSKLEYVPTVAAVGGFLNQNVIPVVPSNLGYGGIVVTYNLFDFGKRERGVKEARLQLEMAQIAAQMTKAQVSAKLKDSYLELVRSRQLSRLAQTMVSVVRLVALSPENPELEAACVKLELEMLEADLAHR
jgi:outer membrane protein